MVGDFRLRPRSLRRTHRLLFRRDCGMARIVAPVFGSDVTARRRVHTVSRGTHRLEATHPPRRPVTPPLRRDLKRKEPHTVLAISRSLNFCILPVLVFGISAKTT